MTTYKVGKGRGTKTVQARQFLNAYDQSLAQWAQGVLHAERNGQNHIRIHRKGEETLYVYGGDWILKHEDGTVSVMSRTEFASTAREVRE